jgi:shikimate dehydrogenase
MIYRLGLVGYPLDHSLSPRLHIAALEAAGLQGSYTCYPVLPAPLPDALDKITGLLQKLKDGRLQGLNVTIPFKQSIYALLDQRTANAERIGTVNTLWCEKERLIGENTDADGFQDDLVKLGFDAPRGGVKTALVLGAGGAARAVVYALVGMGWQVTLVARRLEQATALAESIHHTGMNISVQPHQVEAFMQPYHLIVNTTPLGMPPFEHASPWPEGIPLPAEASVYDLVYQRETPLLKAARAAGLPAAGGLGMLIEQAALSFQIWTGYTESRAAMLKAAGSTINTLAKGSG